jgi:hypothetical protein
MECGIWREPSKANELWVREAMPDYDYLWAKRLGWVSGKSELYPGGHVGIFQMVLSLEAIAALHQ